MKYAPLLLLLLALPLAQAALVTEGTGLDITLLNYEPVPVQPGDVVDLWLLVENEGSSPTGRVTVELIDSYPFTVSNEVDRVKRTASIPAQESFLVKARVVVDKNANSGTNYVRVRVEQGDSGVTLDKNLALAVAGESSTLAITSARTDPEVIAPGGRGTLTVTVQNVGDQRLRNINVELDLDSVDVAPAQGSNSKIIEILQGGESHTFAFDLVALPDAAPNAYKVPVTLAYVDEDGAEQSQEKSIGLVLGSEPELLVYFDSVALTADSRQGEVVVKVVNKGLSEVKLLELEVLEDDGVEVVSESPVVYIGNIDADDFDTASLTLKTTEKSVPVTLRLGYKDALNNPHEETVTLQLDAVSGNGNGGGSAFVWILLIVLVVGGVWWWRRRKGAKRRK